MRTWSWSKGCIKVDGEPVFDFEDFWRDHGDIATEEIAEFIVDACNAAEAGAFDRRTGRILRQAMERENGDPLGESVMDGEIVMPFPAGVTVHIPKMASLTASTFSPEDRLTE